MNHHYTCPVCGWSTKSKIGASNHKGYHILKGDWPQVVLLDEVDAGDPKWFIAWHKAGE